jgi:uncharacterized protein (DUF2252 family)
MNLAPSPEDRAAHLAKRRNAKMARSAHAYMRGNTVKFYEWLPIKRTSLASMWLA